VVLRKSDPTWRFALAANPTNPGLLLELRSDDGTTGLGSACEIRHLGHGLADMRAAVNAVVPLFLDIDSSGQPLADLDRVGGPARAIVQMALLDLVARSRGVAAHQLLGQRRRDGVELIRILSLKSPDEMAAMAVSHQAEGYRHVKIKLDNAADDVDFRRVAAIREAVGPDFGLTVDANQSYEASDALRLCERLAPLNVQVFEQPVPADDLDGLAFLTTRSPVPIEADEAANSFERVQEIASRHAAHGVSIKVPKLGGLDRAAEAIAICGDAGVTVRIGAHVGSQLLNAAALQLAVVTDNLDGPAELAEFARLDDDPVRGLQIRSGDVILPDGPGLGVFIQNTSTGKDAL
jgi:L-Ala-D/L-Glu epimerase